MLGNNLANVIAYPLCACGHRHDRHRHHAPEGCYQCEKCKGYEPCGSDMFDTLFAELPVELAGLPVSTLGPNLTKPDLDIRLGGFADCEGLVLAMVADLAGKEKDKEAGALARLTDSTDELARTAWEIQVDKHHVRAQVLEELELALRMGQHRAAEYGDSDLAMNKAKAGRLARAHQQMANGLRGKAGSGKASEGGRKASDGMTKDERVKRARNAAESRYNGKPGTKSKKREVSSGHHGQGKS